MSQNMNMLTGIVTGVIPSQDCLYLTEINYNNVHSNLIYHFYIDGYWVNTNA